MEIVNGREGNASIKSTKSTARYRDKIPAASTYRIVGIICHRELLITVSAELFRGSDGSAAIFPTERLV